MRRTGSGLLAAAVVLLVVVVGLAGFIAWTLETRNNNHNQGSPQTNVTTPTPTSGTQSGGAQPIDRECNYWKTTGLGPYQATTQCQSYATFTDGRAHTCLDWRSTAFGQFQSIRRCATWSP